MKITVTIALAVLLGLFQCTLTVSAKGIQGYIYAPERTLPNNLLKETPSAAIYSDKDVKNLFLHNLGVLNNGHEISSSAQNLISQHGTKNLISTRKLNFAFLLEGESFGSLFGAEKVGLKSEVEHQAALFDVCNEDSCVLKHLFNKKDDSSVLNNLKRFSRRAHPEAYLYSSNSKVGAQFAESLLTIAANSRGIYIMDQTSEASFKIADNLENCVNSALKGLYTVSIEGRTILQESTGEVVTLSPDHNEDFNQYMSDICSVVGVSTLVRRDPSPSFFTFHISSLAKLEKSLPAGAKVILYQTFKVTYEKFVKNLLSRYNPEEISGQVFVLSPENNLSSGNEESVMIELPEGHYKPWVRVLDEETVTTTKTQLGTVSDIQTSNTIFRGFLIVFVLVTAWVCIELSNMDIQKDSVVYAKFLAADYFRR